MANIGNHTFIDGVGDIRIRDGIVRIDLLTLSATRRDDDGNPVPEFTDQLVMSPAAFLRMVSAMGDTIRQMQEQGLLGSADEAATTNGESEAQDTAVETAKKSSNGSPNFQ